ncbi:MAG: putative addiction module antidote protein [Treponema sp.]|jgi:probable addiction module antidote protein|nr:putative addiction module antidote protein [Treponema sp.]
MGKITFSDWDFADEIKTKEDVVGTLEAVIELAIQEDDPEYLLKAIGDIARSKGMAQLARELSLDRSSLYKSLSPAGNPSFFTIAKVMDNLGFKLSFKQKISA